MPGGDLGEEAHVGLHGKLPLTGDFVARGLGPGFRAAWDRFAARHLASRPPPWPPGGLRLRLRSGGRAAVALVLPSGDAAGRRFPLAALLVLPAPPPVAEADAWCDAALPPLRAAVAGGIGADALWAALDALPRPRGAEAGPGPALLLWAAGAAPLAAEPDDPGGALDALLSSGRSSTP